MQNRIHVLFGNQSQAQFQGAKKKNPRGLTLSALPARDTTTVGNSSPMISSTRSDSFKRQNSVDLDLQDQLVAQILNDFDRDSMQDLLLGATNMKARDSQGRTVLTALAAQMPDQSASVRQLGLRKIVDLLCFWGADPKGTDSEGRTAKMVAEDCGNSEMAQLMAEKERKTGAES